MFLPMISGDLSAGLTIISLKVTLGNFLIDSCSCFISSISAWTSLVPRSQDKALVADSSSFLSNRRYFGDSGQNGSVITYENWIQFTCDFICEKTKITPQNQVQLVISLWSQFKRLKWYFCGKILTCDFSGFFWCFLAATKLFKSFSWE